MKRPYKITNTARLIAIAYGVCYALLVSYLSNACGCSLKAMFQAYGLFWMFFSLAGLLMLLVILMTADRGE